MFDVRRSSFKTIPYGINVTCERLQNNLALMGVNPRLGQMEISTEERFYYLSRTNLLSPLAMSLLLPGIRISALATAALLFCSAT